MRPEEVVPLRGMDELASVFGRSEVVSLDRATPDAETLESSRQAFADHVTQELARLSDAIGASRQPADIDLAHFELQHGTFQSAIAKLAPLRFHTMVLGDGCRVIGTPYDVDWATGNAALALGARNDGKFFVLGIEGPASAGVGVHLTSDTEVDVAISPSGTYQGSWFTVQDAPDWRTVAGLGITVYADGAPTPVASRQVELWNVRGARGLSGHTVSGAIADAANPTFAGTFGPYTLAPVICRLRPGRRLLVWVWAWQVATRSESALAMLAVRVPAITVCSGPPIVIR